MNKIVYISGIFLGVLAVVLGAFGAHGLQRLVDADAIRTFETGVKYQIYHALLLLVLANTRQIPESSKKWVFYLIGTGIVLFSFSIYLLAINSLVDFNFKSIAFLTPIGGTLLIAAWLLLGYRAFKHFK